jgi:hypothetical protein
MKKLQLILMLSIGIVYTVTAQNSINQEISQNYINFPASYNEEDAVTIQLVIDNEVKRVFDIFLPDSEPDFWVFLDVSMFHGEKALLRTRDGFAKNQRWGKKKRSRSDLPI